MKLGEKQELFARLLPRLIDAALDQGFSVRCGELLRTERQARWNAAHCRRCRQTKGHPYHRSHRFVPLGIVNSVHRLKLAADLILFRDGEPLWSSDEYRALGDFWKAQHPLCRWGGDFRDPDGGHFSITHGGTK